MGDWPTQNILFETVLGENLYSVFRVDLKSVYHALKGADRCAPECVSALYSKLNQKGVFSEITSK